MTSSPPTLAQVQARNGLMAEIWRVALDEAHSSKDAPRRMAAMQGLSQTAVIEAYFGAHPEMKEWADAHIAAGTCEDAIKDLQATHRRTVELRVKQREAFASWAAEPLEERCEPPPDTAPGWMKPFMLGPAMFPPTADIPEDRTPTAAPPPERVKNLGGKPPKWDWAAFDREIVRIANEPDGLPERHKLMRQMLDWCMQTWDSIPSDSQVRDRIAARYPG